MKTQSILLAALASAPAALAHTTFTTFYVDGVSQGDGVAMRMSPYPDRAGSPIASLDSDDMACNVEGTKGVSRVQSVRDGATLTFEIRSWADDPSKPSLDRGHYGPCAVYLKKVDSAVKDRGAGDGWFKLFDHGYDASTKRWCTDEIIDNKGLLSINLPKGLEGGSYLARPEILALHAASSGDPQFYTGCAQIFLESSGNLGPEKTVSIPGHVKYNEPSTNFNIYNSDLSTYTVPGPAVAKLVAKSGQAGTSSSTQTEGLKPEGCLVENGNWCGVEVPDFKDEASCWKANENCWDQGEVCWNTAGPTGGKGCELWSTKCKGLETACKSKAFPGPANKGQVLTPEKKAIDVGKIMATVGGGVAEGTSPKTSATNKVESKTGTPAKATPAANEKNTKPASSPAASKPASAQAKPTPAADDTYTIQPVPETDKDAGDKDDTGDEYDDEKPAASVTPRASSAAAPQVTSAPKGSPCQAGGKCVTVTEVATLVQTVYVTLPADAYKRGVEGVQRRKARGVFHS